MRLFGRAKLYRSYQNNPQPGAAYIKLGSTEMHLSRTDRVIGIVALIASAVAGACGAYVGYVLTLETLLHHGSPEDIEASWSPFYAGVSGFAHWAVPTLYAVGILPIGTRYLLAKVRDV